MLWFSLLVLIPLAAVVVKAVRGRLGRLRPDLHQPQTRAALRLTVGTSLLVTAINMVMGTVIAWVLVRDRFWGKARAQRRHRHPVRAADDRRRPGAAVALRAEEPARRRRRRTPGWRSSSRSRSSRCRSWCGPCSRCSRRSRPTSRRPPRRSAPAGSPRSAASSCRPWCRRSPPARRCPSPAASASTARWCCSAATCRTAPRSPRSACSATSRAATPPAPRRVATVMLVVALARDRRPRRHPEKGGPPWLAQRAVGDGPPPSAGCCALLVDRLPVPAGRLADLAGRQEHLRRRAARACTTRCPTRTSCTRCS